MLRRRQEPVKSAEEFVDSPKPPVYNEKKFKTDGKVKGAKMRHFPPTRAILAFLTLSLAAALSLVASGQTVPGDQETVQHQIERAKIFRDAYPVIADVDLYCSPFVYEGELPDLRITEAEKGYEKSMFSDADVVHLNQGKQGGLEIGQVLLVIDIGNSIGDLGRLAVKTGRANVLFLEENRAIVRIEKSCGRISVGSYLVPFEEKETLLGKDIGYDAYAEGETGQAGTIVYLERDYNQIGSGGYAIIDIGEDAGIQVGQQLTIYKMVRDPQTLAIRKDLPQRGIGNAIVIGAGKKSATIKVLSCADPVSKGQTVKTK
jgi:hypothetical protein